MIVIKKTIMKRVISYIQTSIKAFLFKFRYFITNNAMFSVNVNVNAVNIDVFSFFVVIIAKGL